MRKSRGARRWFDWHSWIGIFGGLLLFIICWSGSFAVLSNEIDWLLTPALRVTPQGEQADLAAIRATALSALPEAKVIAVARPLGDHFAAVVTMVTAARDTRLVFVDPYRLQVTGDIAALTVQRFFREFHQDFFGLFGAGKYLVCLFALPLILSLVTALLFYRRWWQRFFHLTTGKGMRAFWSSAHKTAGLWSMWFVALIAFTGLWYLYEHGRFELGDGKFAFVDSYPLAVHQLEPIKHDPRADLPFETLLRNVETARPDIHFSLIYPDRNGYFYAIGQAGDMLVRDRSNSVFLDPRDGSVAYSQTPSDLSAYWHWSDMADPLHFGDFGGLPSKLIWFVFGIALSGLCLTGAWLHVKRLQRDPRNTGWRGAAVAGAASLLPPLLTIPSVWYALHMSGPMVDGHRTMANLPPATSVFLIGWAVLTLAIMAGWVWLLIRAQRRHPAPALRPRTSAAE